WIPILFELTVLFSAVGMVLAFCYLCQLAPFVKKHHFHLRSTDDLLVMVLECTPKSDENEVADKLKSLGAGDVNVQVAEDGWWLGSYGKEDKLYENREPAVI